MNVSKSVVSTSGTCRHVRIPAAIPDQTPPPTAEKSNEQRMMRGAGPGIRTARKAANAEPMSNCPSWPMLTIPARVATIMPVATSSNGVIVVSVSPHAPAEPTLPSSSADHTADAEPPVAATSSDETSSAPATEVAYSTTVRTRSRRKAVRGSGVATVSSAVTPPALPSSVPAVRGPRRVDPSRRRWPHGASRRCDGTDRGSPRAHSRSAPPPPPAPLRCAPARR